jgi:predicted Zn-dependent peptidase
MRGGAEHLSISGAVENARLGAALTVLRQTLEGLEQGKIGAVELDNARWSVARGFGVRFQSNESIVRALLKARNEDRDAASIDSYPAELAGVTSGALRADFIRCTTAPVLSIVGDEPTVRAALREAWPPPAATPAPASSPSDRP